MVYMRACLYACLYVYDSISVYMRCKALTCVVCRLFFCSSFFLGVLDGRWGPNTKMFVNAVGMHPDRLTNMYFAYVFVLRAIGKARPFLMVRGHNALRAS